MHGMDERAVKRPVDRLPQLVQVRAQSIAIGALVGPQQGFEVAARDSRKLIRLTENRSHWNTSL